MNSHRFARTGRCRFIICCGILILIIGMVAIFHSSQLQLDESRQQRLICEQQQETLNERLTSLVKQKFHMEKHHERERNEELQSKRNLEQTIKDLEERIGTDKLRYTNLDESYKKLKNEYDAFKIESANNRKQYDDSKRNLEENIKYLSLDLKQKLQEIDRLKSEYNNEKSINENQMDKLQAENEDLKYELKKYKPGDVNMAFDINKNFDKSNSYNVNTPNKKSPINPNESVSEINFNMQEPVSDGVYHLTYKPFLLSNQTNPITNKNSINKKNELKKADNNNNGNNNGDNSVGVGVGVGVDDNNSNDKQLKVVIKSNDNKMGEAFLNDEKHNKSNRSLILNSVENFQIVPKLIKPQEYKDDPNNNNVLNVIASLDRNENLANIASSPAIKSEQQVPSGLDVVNTNNSSTTPQKYQINVQQKQHDNHTNGSSSSSPPLAMPPNQKKLPENVAPIPDRFDTYIGKIDTNEMGHQQQAESQIAGDNNSKNDKIGKMSKMNEPKAEALKSIVGNNNNNNDNNYDTQVHHQASENNFLLQQQHHDNDNNNDNSNAFDRQFNQHSNQMKLGKHDGRSVFDTYHKVNNKLKSQNAHNTNNDDDNVDVEISLGGGGVGHSNDGGDNDNDAALANLSGGATGDIVAKQSNNNHPDRLKQQQQQNLLDSSNLNNEVAADQGKEFGDPGMRVDENDMDDADDDDYLNPGERLQGGEKAIRN